MKWIKSIEFEFENCDSYTFDSDYIGEFDMSRIEKTISRIAANAILEEEICHDFSIEIFSEANKEYKPFEQCEPIMIFDRIKEWNDISGITLTYADGAKSSYAVDYTDEVDGQLGSPNINQKSYTNQFGDLYIVINAKKDIKDYFPIENIEDKEHNKYYKSMIINEGLEEEYI